MGPKFSELIRNGLLHLWWYVTTVYAIKLRNDIFLATWTIHSFIPFYKVPPSSKFVVPYLRAGCVPDVPVRKTLNFHQGFFRLPGRRRYEARQKRRELRPKRRPDSASFTSRV